MNSTILNVNNSLQERLTTIKDIINSFQNNSTVINKYVNATVNTIKGITIKINTNITLQNATVSTIEAIDSTNFTLLNSTVKNNYVKLLSSLNFTNSIVNSSRVSIISYDSVINSTVHYISTNVTLFQNYVKDYINNTVTNIKLEENFMNTTLNYVNTNVTLTQAYLKSTINTSINNITVFDTFLNSTVNRLNNNVTLDEIFVNDTVKKVENNVTLLNNYVKTTINSTINNIKLSNTIINSTIHDVSNNITVFNDYVHATINTTINNIKLQTNIINSTVAIIKTNITILQNYIEDYINTSINSINITMALVKDTIGNINFTALQTLYITDSVAQQIQLNDRILNSLNNVITTDGTGSYTQPSQTTASFQQQILDPYLVTTSITEANLTTNNSLIWFGNPISSNYSDVVVTDNPEVIILSGTQMNTINVSIYSDTTGLKLISYHVYTSNSSEFILPLDKSVLNSGEIYRFNISGGKNYTIQSEIDWSGSIPFIWNYNSATQTYSYKSVIPSANSSYGTAIITKGVYLNTTFQTANYQIGFPINMTVNINSVKVYDYRTGNYLVAGVNYYTLSTGVEFNRNNYTGNTYLITFNTASNITTNSDLSIPLGSATKGSYNGNIYITQSGSYTNIKISTITANLYLSLNGIPEVAYVVINGQAINSSMVTISGSQIIVSGVTIHSKQTITIQVYYTLKPTVNGYQFLFKYIYGVFSVWTMLGFLLLIILVPIYERFKRSKGNKFSALGIWMGFALIWWIIFFAYLGGIL
jgi:hypothetical protein